jgi:hypothetical protein
MRILIENLIHFYMALGAVLGLMRLYFQGYHKIDSKKSLKLLISLPILILLITFLPQIKMIFEGGLSFPVMVTIGML